MSSASAPEVTETVSAVEGASLLPAASPAPVRGRRLVGRKAATAAAASADSVPNGSAIPADASTTELAVRAAAPRRFVGGIKQLVPDSVLHDPVLNAAIAALPANYNFEIHKCVWRLREAGARCIGLQFPEGLLMYACMISDIIERHVPGATTFIMGDVTYGACCVDDFTAKVWQQAIHAAKQLFRHCA
jgi:2-(3-amino-3-carboxypropyl)histidine synthase